MLSGSRQKVDRGERREFNHVVCKLVASMVKVREGGREID